MHDFNMLEGRGIKYLHGVLATCKQVTQTITNKDTYPLRAFLTLETNILDVVPNPSIKSLVYNTRVPKNLTTHMLFLEGSMDQ